MKKWYFIFFVLLLWMCSTPIKAKTVVDISKKTSLRLKKGQKIDVSFQRAVNNQLQEIDLSQLKWKNSNPAIATVDVKNGFSVVAKENGTTILSTDYYGQSLTLTLQVFDSIAIKNSTILLDIGESINLEVVTQPSVSLKGFNPSYQVENSQVLQIDEKGVITGKSVGKTKVIVSYLDVKTEAEIEVIDKPDFVFGIQMLHLNVDASTNIPFTASLYGEDSKEIVWSSKNSNIAKVNSKGAVFGVAPGSTQIIAKVRGIDYPLPVQVISTIEALTIQNPEIVLNLNETHTIAYKIKPAIYQDVPVIWDSSKPSVASVSDGVIKALSAGETVISARINNIVKKIRVQVNVPLKGIILNPKQQVIKQGQRFGFEIEMIPKNSNTKIIPIYSSSNNEIATVDSYGNVLGVSPGQATIFVQHENFVASSKVIVEYAANEEGLKSLNGTIHNHDVDFNLQGIDDLKEFVFHIPYSESFFDTSTPEIKIHINQIGFIDGLLIKRFELDKYYANKKFDLIFVDKDEQIVAKYHFDKYQPSQNNTIFPEVAYMESTFPNIKTNLYNLKLPVNLGEKDQLEIHLKNNPFSKNLKVYETQHNNRLKLARAQEIEVSDKTVIKIDSLKAGEYYLSDQNVESPLMVIVLLSVGILLIVIASIVVNKISDYLKKSEIEKRTIDESVNYQYRKKEE